MSSGLFIFFGFALLLVVFLGLRKAIRKDNTTRVTHGSHVDVYAEKIKEYRPSFIIKGPIDKEDGQLYWSNTEGWGFKEQADKYTDREEPLPIEATGIEYID